MVSKPWVRAYPNKDCILLGLLLHTLLHYYWTTN